MKDICEIVAELSSHGLDCRAGESMKNHTSLRIGGPADCLVLPRNENELRTVLEACSAARLPINIIGNGTNLLVADSGVRGVTVKLGPAFSGIIKAGSTLSALAGTPLASVCEYAAKSGLSGLEFAAGIPGTVGGAVFMNAGAYGGEVCGVLSRVRVITKTGEMREYAAAECGFAYRESRFQNEPDSIILSADFALTGCDENEIRARMAQHREARRKSQPLDMPNAGSAFKRPDTSLAAAAMIDACALKGVRVGGAEISRKHAGFIVNTGGATAQDVCRLLDLAAERVYSQYSVYLTPEYRFLGDFEQ